jgi:hypothetical protein
MKKGTATNSIGLNGTAVYRKGLNRTAMNSIELNGTAVYIRGLNRSAMNSRGMKHVVCMHL